MSGKIFWVTKCFSYDAFVNQKCNFAKYINSLIEQMICILDVNRELVII